MITFLITMSAFIICLVLAIVLINNFCCYSDQGIGLALVISSAVLGTATLGMAVAVIISNSANRQIQIRIHLNETVTELNNTKTYVEQELARGNVVVVNDYNAKVRSFKEEIGMEQSMLSNPWINWFHSPVYNEFNINSVSYVSYTVK